MNPLVQRQNQLLTLLTPPRPLVLAMPYLIQIIRGETIADRAPVLWVYLNVGCVDIQNASVR